MNTAEGAWRLDAPAGAAEAARHTAPSAVRAGGASARDALRAATRPHHDAMERSPAMAALLGPGPAPRDVARAIAAQLAVIGPLEAALADGGEAPADLFEGYVLRAPLARADLGRLGVAALPPPAPPVRPLRTRAAWLGFRYVMEGSSLGGALITRHLATVPLPPLRFFDPHGADRGAAWRRFCLLLDTALSDADSRAEAGEAAGAIFDAIGAALGGAAGDTVC